MPDIFVDCEFNADGIFLLGAHCAGVTDENNRFQLHGNALKIQNFQKFIEQCGTAGRRTLLFCHGPDFGHIETHFGIGNQFRENYFCINAITAYRALTRFQTASLAHLAAAVRCGWRDPDVQHQITPLWRSGNRENRQRVLDYNWDDCVNLGLIIKSLRRRPNVNNKTLIDNARLLPLRFQ